MTTTNSPAAQPRGYQRRHCSKCGEDLGFSESDPCSKCGTEAQPQGGELLPCRVCSSTPIKGRWFREEGVVHCSKTSCFMFERPMTAIQWNTLMARADLPRATADAFDKELVEAVATPWICAEEKPCEEAIAVHWDEMITALTAVCAPRATGETTVDEPRKAINFLIALEHQVHRNHEYHPDHCAECSMTETIANKLREQLKLTDLVATRTEGEG